MDGNPLTPRSIDAIRNEQRIAETPLFWHLVHVVIKHARPAPQVRSE